MISGDSSYFSRVKCLAVLKSIKPEVISLPPTTHGPSPTKSFVVYPLQPILPLTIDKSPIVLISQDSGIFPNDESFKCSVILKSFSN